MQIDLTPSVYTTLNWMLASTVPEGVRIVTPVPEPEHFLLVLACNGRKLVSIKSDGTVIVHEPGADKEAARVFYEALEFNGKSLVARIAELEAELVERHPAIEVGKEYSYRGRPVRVINVDSPVGLPDFAIIETQSGECTAVPVSKLSPRICHIHAGSQCWHHGTAVEVITVDRRKDVNGWFTAAKVQGSYGNSWTVPVDELTLQEDD